MLLSKANTGIGRPISNFAIPTGKHRDRQVYLQLCHSQRQTPGYAGLPPTVPIPLVCALFQDNYSLTRPNAQVLSDLTPYLPVTSFRRFRKTVVLASFRNVCNYLLVDTEFTSQDTQIFRNIRCRSATAVHNSVRLLRYRSINKYLLFQTQAPCCDGNETKWQYLKLSQKIPLLQQTIYHYNCTTKAA